MSGYRESAQDGGMPAPEVVMTGGFYYPMKGLRAEFTSDRGLCMSFRTNDLVIASIEAGSPLRWKFHNDWPPSAVGITDRSVPALTRILLDAYEFVAEKLGLDPVTGMRPNER